MSSPTASVATVSEPPLAQSRGDRRFAVLDGWRAISILSVLGCHMFPLGPKWLDMNYAAGLFGMSLFFTLSGFLITTNLLQHQSVAGFLVRRFFRIIPLMYLYVTVVLLFYHASPLAFLAHYGFVINYQTWAFIPPTTPLWSVCVEMHFYLFIASLVALLGKRGLYAIPAFALLVTGFRVYSGDYAGDHTHTRVDEILAGSCLAMLYLGKFPQEIATVIRRIPLPVLLAFLVAASHRKVGALLHLPPNTLLYLRPYAGAALIGHTLLADDGTRYRLLKTRLLRYIADISYALYVIHPVYRIGWLGTESSKALTYLVKRPISIAVMVPLAHLSTFHYEKFWIRWGKTISQRLEDRAKQTAAAGQ